MSYRGLLRYVLLPVQRFIGPKLFKVIQARIYPTRMLACAHTCGLINVLNKLDASTTLFLHPVRIEFVVQLSPSVAFLVGLPFAIRVTIVMYPAHQGRLNDM